MMSVPQSGSGALMGEADQRSSLPPAVQVMRPKHWIKNVFVLAALVFAQKLGDPGAVVRALLAFACFCALSSAIYVFNDVTDRETDRMHPAKRHRPVASGALSVKAASVLAVALAVGGLAGAAALGVPFASVATAYVFMNLAYSMALKRVVILDVMVVATGFLLRAWAGAVVLGVEMSHWLALCTGLLALFLGFVKRRQEIESLEGATAQRPILREYSLPFLDQMISVVTASTVLAYSLYAFSPEVAERVGTRHLGLTIPFVLFGIFRYLYLVHRHGEGESPTLLVLSDPPLLATVLLWGAAVVVAVYAWR
jgi:4-hydroxybenzoate polyprenyltransferase